MNLWMPGAYLNFIRESEYLKSDWAKEHQIEHEFKDKTEAAQAYVDDMISGKGNRYMA